MILRRVMQHVKEQNWTAIGIELVIVVLGVFLGMQVSNWNDSRVERERELVLLGELRAELADSIRQTAIKQKAFEQIALSGERAIAFLDSGNTCGDTCWPVIVDFFHASQWQAMIVELPTYDELRRNGWPRKRAIVDAMEAYKRQALQVAKPLDQPPAYRALVRGLIPFAIHEPYWASCFQLADGEEAYVEDCPQGVPAEISATGVDAIVRHPDIHRTLTEWVGYSAASIEALDSQNQSASRAMKLVGAELGEQQ
ncbi:hypothetical protein [Dokdonella sp.]|uniref:hypothetical protein n=1 Tax=Dokdonella sp. TaxID=2291710 RepID=UPI003527656C